MASSVRDYDKLAVDIIKAVGGKENIVKASRCATRLRLVLKETTNEAKENVSNLTGVITVVESGGQFQVVIGTHVGSSICTIYLYISCSWYIARMFNIN